MVTQLSETPSDVSQRNTWRQVWLLGAQICVVGLLAMALHWSPTPQRSQQALLIAVLVANVVIAAVPRCRRTDAAAALGGITLALACSLSIDTLWETPIFPDAYVPLMSPVMFGASVVCAVWGLIARARIGGQSSLGMGALVGGLLIAATSTIIYVGLNHSAYFRTLYTIDAYQWQEILAIGTLYSLALWLGGTGIRHEGRWVIQPALSALVLGIFLLLWHVRG